MSRELVHLDREDESIITLTLARPEKRNALSCELLRQLRSLLRELPTHDRQRLLLLRAEGPAFCAGADLEETLDPQRAEENGHLLIDVFTALSELELTTIALVDGAAVATGAALLLCCDGWLVTERFSLWFPETQRGLVPAFGQVLLRRRLSMAQMSRLLLFGHRIEAQEALDLGLAIARLSQEHKPARDLQEVQRLLQLAPHALRITKQIMAKGLPSLEEELKAMLKYHLEARHSHEAKEGLSALVEKRSPHFCPTLMAPAHRILE